MAPGRLARAALMAGLASALASAATARGDGFSVLLSPGYTQGTTTTTDETGLRTRSESSVWLQKYRLALDDQLWPLVKLSAGGLIDWTQGTTRTNGVTTTTDQKRWTFFSGLRAGSPLLNGGADVDYRTESGRSRSLGVTTEATPVSRLALSGRVGWFPIELPSLDLRVAYTDTHDADRQSLDVTTEELGITSRYQPDPSLQLQYGLRLARANDHRAGVVRDEVSNGFTGIWTAQSSGGRVAGYLSYNLAARTSRTTLTGANGSAQVLTRQLAVGGLSIVDTLITTPDRVTLNANAALIDGDLTTSAGLNLGTSASTAAAQGQAREIGAQLANVVTPVNTLLLYLDRPASAAANLLTFAVWQSDDNVTWTAVADPLPSTRVEYSLFPGLYYFKLSLPQTIQARYLKVVARPLAASATQDPQLAELWVTELQLFLSQSADQVRGTDLNVGGSMSGSLRVRLTESPMVTWDITANLSHVNNPTSATWSILNGLSLQQRLSRTLALGARVDRTDSDSGHGHESVDRWSATLAAEPIATLGGGLTYGGLHSQGRSGWVLSHTLTGFVRADLYEGIATSANGTASTGRVTTGQTQRGASVAGTLSLVPNRFLSLNSSLSWVDTVLTGGGRAESRDKRTLFDASATLSPFPALTATAGYTRYLITGQIQETANWQVAVSPFQGGALLLRYSYQETLDLSTDTRTRLQGPNLRWSIRPSWFLDAGWTRTETITPAQRVVSDGAFANLTINLH